MAICCIQVPISDTAWPKKNSRKFRELSARTSNFRLFIWMRINFERQASDGPVHERLFSGTMCRTYATSLHLRFSAKMSLTRDFCCKHDTSQVAAAKTLE